MRLCNFIYEIWKINLKRYVVYSFVKSFSSYEEWVNINMNNAMNMQLQNYNGYVFIMKLTGNLIYFQPVYICNNSIQTRVFG